MSIRLEIPGKKSKFNLSDDKNNAFTAGLDRELCNYTTFKEKSSEAMYSELIRAINKVGLIVSKRHARRYSHI